MSIWSFRSKDLSISFGQKVVFSGLSFCFPKGGITAIVGPSGVGKSTLLRVLANLEKPTAGTLEISAPKHDLGFVFQNATLLPWLTARENITLPIVLKATPSGEEDAKTLATEWLEKISLAKSGHLFPYQLSGGMQMRVSLARALIGGAKTIFLDEPFSALDEGTRSSLQDLLRKWVEEFHITAIFVTHSINEASYLADHILALKSSNLFVEFPTHRPMGIGTYRKQESRKVLVEKLERILGVTL